MKKRYVFILSFIILICVSNSAIAAQNCGAWARESVISAISIGVLDSYTSRDYYSPITRIELAELMSKSLEKLNILFDENNFYSFNDTTNQNAVNVSSLGIMNGYGDGTFMPESITSRQEMAKVILVLKSVVDNEPLTLPIELISGFNDFDDLSPWAKPYVTKATIDGLISGYTDGNFKGLYPVSWQEAIVMLDRVFDFSKIKNNIISFENKALNLKAEITNNILKITWNRIDDTKEHTLTITEQRMSRYENDIPPNSPLSLNFFEETSYSLSINPNKKYTITISCGSDSLSTSVITEKVTSEDMRDILENYPATQEAAENMICEVTVPIWQIVDNIKVPSKTTLQVHSMIGEEIVKIFEEIFNGSEQFPIKDVTGYTWRGGTTEHNGGTAIDINCNENYCIYNDGTTIGTHWKPYDDPYSITPYGDVVRAFEKYGFTWGGDSWSNPKDYMHFSYLGT